MSARDRLVKDVLQERDATITQTAKKYSFKSFILETAINIVIILAIVGVVRLFLITPFVVNGSSMENTFYSGEYIIIDKLSYRFTTPSRGDVVIIKPPISDEKDFYIKRVIGLPGEIVKLQDKKVYICNDTHPDCFAIDESSYLKPENLNNTCARPSSCNDTSYTIPDNAYFVLGDNRIASSDSRRFEERGGTFYVPFANFEGRALFAVWPLTKLGFISHEDYEKTYEKTFDIPKL